VQHLIVDVTHAAQRDLMGGLPGPAGWLKAVRGRRVVEPQPDIHPVPGGRVDGGELGTPCSVRSQRRTAFWSSGSIPDAWTSATHSASGRPVRSASDSLTALIISSGVFAMRTA
jgi:hypothetical protein